jgi:ribosomal protein S27E
MSAYAVPSAPGPTRKTVKFKCRHCGQKVLVDAALSRKAITCPTCRQIVPAPQPGRLWIELCGAVIVFLFGLAIGHGLPGGKSIVPPPAVAPAAIAPQKAPAKTTKPDRQHLPNWFSNGDTDS